MASDGLLQPARGDACKAPLPPDAPDVLVLGAGPAGSACARMLARSGVRTLIVDQQTFPRDKTCGDGLIPDSHAALERLGLADAVAARAHRVTHVRCVGPGGGQVDVPGRLSVLPRRELDALLLDGAREAGASFAAPWRFEGTVEDGGRVAGARLRQGDDERIVRARHVVLATGAAAGPLVAAQVCERRAPSAMGIRGYVRHPGLADRIPHLEVVWHPRIAPGYGWIFPCGDGVFNIGAGLIDSRRRTDDKALASTNLRALFERFTQVHPAARALMDGGTLTGPLKGAPLRASLQGAAWSRPGLLVVGEAAGSTYSFTGEGIGKAMETGILAAEAIVGGGLGVAAAHRDGAADALGPTGAPGPADDPVGRAYRAALARLKPKFDLYERGNRVNHWPWVTELLIRRAARSARIRRRMEDLLEERSTPAQLITLRGMVKLLLE